MSRSAPFENVVRCSDEEMRWRRNNVALWLRITHAGTLGGRHLVAKKATAGGQIYLDVAAGRRCPLNVSGSFLKQALNISSEVVN